jgi:hypothetical protein
MRTAYHRRSCHFISRCYLGEVKVAPGQPPQASARAKHTGVPAGKPESLPLPNGRTAHAQRKRSVTCTTPGSRLDVSEKPLFSNSSSIGVLSGKTSATSS